MRALASGLIVGRVDNGFVKWAMPFKSKSAHVIADAFLADLPLVLRGALAAEGNCCGIFHCGQYIMRAVESVNGMGITVQPRVFTWAWRNAGDLRRQRFYEVLTAQGKDGLFDDKYIELIQKRRSSSYKIAFRVFSLQMPILIFLVLSLIPVAASVSVLGISPSANRNLREMLLIVSGLLGMAAAGLNLHAVILSEILGAYSEKRSRGDAKLKGYLNIGYGVDFAVLPETSDRNLNTSGWYAAFIAVMGLGILLLFAVVLITGFAIHVLVLRDVYVDPSFSQGVSIGVIVFVLFTDAFTVGLTLFTNGPVLMKDFTNANTVLKIFEKDPEKGAAIYKKIAESQKPGMFRRVTRVKMPKKLPEV
jgi:hypothetical protein